MDLEKIAIARLQDASRMSLQVYQQPLIVITSGGKDSTTGIRRAESVKQKNSRGIYETMPGDPSKEIIPKEFAHHSKYQRNYILYVLAFEQMLKEWERRGKMQGSWNMGATGEEVFHLWMEDGVLLGQFNFGRCYTKVDNKGKRNGHDWSGGAGYQANIGFFPRL